MLNRVTWIPAARGLSLILALLTFTAQSVALEVAPERSSAKTNKTLVTAKNSMVVTNNPWASKAAQQILRSGGNASDAAITAALVLGLTEPQSSGIGGGGYALIYRRANQQLTAFDGREVAPHSASGNMFLASDGQPMSFESAMLTPQSIGVPSEVAMLYAIHQQFGRLSWPELIAPALKLAENGFPLSQRLYDLLLSDQEILKNNPKIAAVYFTKQGTVKPVGSIISNKAYAKTLGLIAKNPQEMQTGKVAADIIKTINEKAGSQMFNSADLSNYKVLTYPALCSSYRSKYRVCSIPPSSSGGVTVQELIKIYAANYYTVDYNDPKWMYNFLEASKLAYADRNQYLADLKFVTQPISGLLAESYIISRAHLVSPDMAQVTPVAAGNPQGIDPTYAPDNSPKPHGTTSIAIVDKDGNAVSMTVTIEHQFGSHLFVDGFFLNNELTDFSFEASNAAGKPIANRVEAGKRPRSSIAPTMVFDQKNQLQLVAGSPGGSQIICYVAKSLIQMLDMQRTALQAGSSGNLCAVNRQPVVEGGSDLSARTAYLQARGESVISAELVSGETNIQRIPGGWSGAADPRREGVALGN